MRPQTITALRKAIRTARAAYRYRYGKWERINRYEFLASLVGLSGSRSYNRGFQVSRAGYLYIG